MARIPVVCPTETELSEKRILEAIDKLTISVNRLVELLEAKDSYVSPTSFTGPVINTSNMKDCIDWAIEQHVNTNHLYDGLPYKFHLDQVWKYTKCLIDPSKIMGDLTYLISAYGHDLIEDTRVTYNDVKNQYGEQIADVIYLLTNLKGRSRAERANDDYYNGILNNPIARIIKIADRLANMEYSMLTHSNMLDKYLEEEEHFKTSLNISPHFNFRDVIIECMKNGYRYGSLTNRI